MKVSSISERLKFIMDNHNLKQVDILEKCKPYCKKYNVRLAKNDLSQYVSGKVEPKSDKLSILGLALGVSEAWLAGYDVPMELDICSLFQKLNNADKEKIMKKIQQIIQSYT